MRVALLALAVALAGCADLPSDPDCGDLNPYECWEQLYGQGATRQGSATIPVIIIDSEFHVTPRDGDGQLNPAFLFHCGGATWRNNQLDLWLNPFQDVPEAVLVYRAHPDANWSHVDSFDSSSHFVATPASRADLRAMFDADLVLQSGAMTASALHLPGQTVTAGGPTVTHTSSYEALGWDDAWFDVEETQHIWYAGLAPMMWTMGAFYCD